MSNQQNISVGGGARLMAPWWRDLLAAKADGKVSATEVAAKIAPHKDLLAHDEVYRANVKALLAKGGDAVATRFAKPKIEQLLADNPLVFKFDAKVLGRAHFHPGSGIVP